jgi:hypothetical protein
VKKGTIFTSDLFFPLGLSLPEPGAVAMPLLRAFCSRERERLRGREKAGSSGKENCRLISRRASHPAANPHRQDGLGLHAVPPRRRPVPPHRRRPPSWSATPPSPSALDPLRRRRPRPPALVRCAAATRLATSPDAGRASAAPCSGSGSRGSGRGGGGRWIERRGGGAGEPES